jgi:hypothetical protein
VLFERTTGSHLGIARVHELRMPMIGVARVHVGRLSEWPLDRDGPQVHETLGLSETTRIV